LTICELKEPPRYRYAPSRSVGAISWLRRGDLFATHVFPEIVAAKGVTGNTAN